MPFNRTAARLARLFRLQPLPPAVLDIDLSALSPAEPDVRPNPALPTIDQVSAPGPADEAQDWRSTGPWRTQPGVRYRL
jgi:hypothetical protein